MIEIPTARSPVKPAAKRALVWLAVATVLALSSINLCNVWVFSAIWFGDVQEAHNHGISLPAITAFVGYFIKPLRILSIMLPIAAIALPFIKGLKWTYFSLGLLGVIAITEGIVAYYAWASIPPY
jgi:hypothetical protein